MRCSHSRSIHNIVLSLVFHSSSVHFESFFLFYLFCIANWKVRFSLRMRIKKKCYETHFCFVCLSKIGIYSVSANYRFTKVVLELANEKKNNENWKSISICCSMFNIYFHGKMLFSAFITSYFLFFDFWLKYKFLFHFHIWNRYICSYSIWNILYVFVYLVFVYLWNIDIIEIEKQNENWIYWTL